MHVYVYDKEEHVKDKLAGQPKTILLIPRLGVESCFVCSNKRNENGRKKTFALKEGKKPIV